jgi:hypothetical protein
MDIAGGAGYIAQSVYITVAPRAGGGRPRFMPELRCNMYRLSSAVVVGLLIASSSAAQAETLSFNGISNNKMADIATGEAQLFVDVIDYGNNQVLFNFRNTGPNASSITDVYFEDGALLGIAALIDKDDNGGHSGVDFSQGASPGNLPSANSASPPFQATAGFTADSDSPVQPYGVNPGEVLGVVFNLKNNFDYADVLSQLREPPSPGDDSHHSLRIGIKVQGFAGGGSETFVNEAPPGPPPPPGGGGGGGSIVPEPSSIALLGFGAFGLFGYGWRRRRQPAA